MSETQTDTIVLVHGLWVTPRSWEGWIEHYEQKGYRVLAPAYPGFEVQVESLNADPTPIEQVTIPAIVEKIEGIIDEFDSSPIIIAHDRRGHGRSTQRRSGCRACNQATATRWSASRRSPRPTSAPTCGRSTCRR